MLLMPYNSKDCLTIMQCPYSTKLNKYPEMIMSSVTTPKKIPINRQVITFFNIVASGIDKPITAIIKAMAVPSGIPLATKTSTIGTTLAGLAYIGTARITANGTPHQCFALSILSKKPSGI